MHDMNVQVRVHDRATKVIGTANIVVNGVALGLGVLHRIRGRTLFCEVNDSVRLFCLDEVNKQVIFFGNVEVDELDLFSRNFFPCLTADLSGRAAIVRN